MGYDRLNVVAGGVLPAGSTFDPLEAGMSDKAESLAGWQPFGSLMGRNTTIEQGWGLEGSNSWKSTNIGTPTAASASWVAPTSTDPFLYRLASGTANTTGIGAQASDGTTGTALARFFAKAGQLIHERFRFRVSHLDAYILIGLTEVNTTPLSTAGAVAATDGIFLYKAAGSSNLVGVVKRGGVTNSQVTLSTGIVANQWYDVGGRFDTTFGSWWLDSVQTGVDLSGGTYQPNAALTLTIAIVNSTANSRNLDISGMFAGQETF